MAFCSSARSEIFSEKKGAVTVVVVTIVVVMVVVVLAVYVAC